MAGIGSIGNFYDDYTHVRPFSKPGLIRLLADTKFELVKVLGYTGGRSAVERLIGKALGAVAPHIWCALARKA
jgi:hypothetical protein